MLVGATVFVLGAIAAGVIIATGEDGDSASPGTDVVAGGTTAALPTQPTVPEQEEAGAKPDSGGGDARPTKSAKSDSSQRDASSDTARPVNDEVECPFEREQCKQLKKAWNHRESHPLQTGPNAKCPYDREQCKQLKKAWESAESHPLETGGDPEEIDCPYGREQCKQLWEAWQAAQ